MRQPCQGACRSCRLVVAVDVAVRISLTLYCSHALSYPGPVPHRSREPPRPHTPVWGY